MKFEQDKQDKNEAMNRDAESRPQDDDILWTKEEGKPDRRFDFAAFFGQEENLDDKITEVLDGQDLLHPDSYGDFSPDYVPYVPFDGEHGRHEAPGSELPEEPAQAGEEEDFQEEAPPRPKVMVADPAPRVYVTPDSEYNDYEEYERKPARRGLSGGQKALVGIVIAATVIIVGLASLLGGSGDEDANADADSTPAPTLSSEIRTELTETPEPQETDNVTQGEPVASMYTITVTAGSGGSVSPSGAVSVEEGSSASFSIQPNDGYVISQILVDGSSVSVASSYTFSDVTANHTLYVVFQAEAEATPEPTPESEITPEPTPEPTLEPEPTPEITPEPEPEAVAPEEDSAQEEEVPESEETVQESEDSALEGEAVG